MNSRITFRGFIALTCVVFGCDNSAQISTGADGGMDMEVDAGPCGVCSGNLVCIEGADAGAMCGCEDDDHCPASGNAACDTETHQCVQCTEDADCGTAALSRCDVSSHSCAPCVQDDQCGNRFPAARACDVGEGCVQCTNLNRTACSGHVCDALMHTCTDRIAGDTMRCEECVSDGDCDSNHACVEMLFGDPASRVGFYCLPIESTVASETCADPANRPYVAAHPTTSIDGTATTVCGLGFATCDALVDYRVQSCTAAGAEGSATCGHDGIDDGVCEQVDSSMLNLCTVRCGTAADCPGMYVCNMSTGTCDVGSTS